MNAEQNIKLWAAKRLNIDPATIQNVDFEQEGGHWYSEVTYEPGYNRAVVRYFDERAAVRRGYIDLVDENFMDLIKEIFEAGEEAG